jgi:hypothetical protein
MPFSSARQRGQPSAFPLQPVVDFQEVDDRQGDLVRCIGDLTSARKVWGMLPPLVVGIFLIGEFTCSSLSLSYTHLHVKVAAAREK